MRSAAPAVEPLETGPIYRAPELLRRAWDLPVAKTYFPLLSQSLTSLCGPTSAANVLRSLGLSSHHNPFGGIGFRAMSVDQLAKETAAQVPAGWQVRTVRPQAVDELRAELRHSNALSHRYIANFNRRPLFGRGGGHHSPLGGYLEDEDLAFVLDVNGSYGPWLARAPRLFEVINTTADRATGKTRGLVRFERLPNDSASAGEPV